MVVHDHTDINDDDRVIRRISSEFFATGPTPNSRRISRMAYQASTDTLGGMSIDIEKLIVEAGLDPRAHVTNPRFMGSVVFSAGFLRQQGLSVGFDPLPDNPYHGEVWGKFSDGLRNRLLKNARWFVEIQGVDLC